MPQKVVFVNHPTEKYLIICHKIIYSCSEDLCPEKSVENLRFNIIYKDEPFFRLRILIARAFRIRIIY